MDLRRLRIAKYGPAFQVTLQKHMIRPGSERARALSDAIRRLRIAERLPIAGDQEVELWGHESFWAHTFATRLWIYYRTDPTGSDEYVEIMSVRDYLHEQ